MAKFYIWDCENIANAIDESYINKLREKITGTWSTVDYRYKVAFKH